MSPVLEPVAPGAGEPAQRGRIVRSDAAERDEVLGPFEDVHRVELDGTDLVEQAAQRRRARLPARRRSSGRSQSLGADGQPSGLTIGDLVGTRRGAARPPGHVETGRTDQLGVINQFPADGDA